MDNELKKNGERTDSPRGFKHNKITGFKYFNENPKHTKNSKTFEKYVDSNIKNALIARPMI